MPNGNVVLVNDCLIGTFAHIDTAATVKTLFISLKRNFSHLFNLLFIIYFTFALVRNFCKF